MGIKSAHLLLERVFKDKAFDNTLDVECGTGNSSIALNQHSELHLNGVCLYDFFPKLEFCF